MGRIRRFSSLIAKIPCNFPCYLKNLQAEAPTERDYPDRPLLGVGAIIVQDERILLVRRSNPPLQGEWSIPGGLVETGETTKEAILREVREETGLEIEVVRLAEVFERILRDRESRVQYHFVLIDYLCQVIAGEAHAASDVSEVRWVKSDELEKLAVAPETCEVIRRTVQGLGIM